MANTNLLPNFLPNSTTKIQTATYVSLNDSDKNSKSGKALTKFGFAGSLRLQKDEVNTVQKSLSVAESSAQKISADENFWSLLRSFEGAPLASELASPKAFVNIDPTYLESFGSGLVTIRRQNLQRLEEANATGEDIGKATDLLNTAIVQSKSFVNIIEGMQVGMLNLERLEMTPAGIERGGLLATIPLAPREHTFVSTKEWSVTTQEFTSIVTDSLDNYSETGVTENTQLTQATTSQIAHNNQFNVTASASGGVNFAVVSGSASASSAFTSQDQNSQSATTSRQNAVQTTRKASSRVKQSHKTTISTTTVTGTSSATSRRLENPSDTDAMRIDYFSLMRKWYVALYRYGLRLTYDITVPEPGAMLRETYAQLVMLNAESSQQLQFNIKYSDIKANNYTQLADKYSAQVSPPPVNSEIMAGGTDVTMSDINSPGNFTDWPIQFTVPDGYQIDHITLSAHIGDNHPGDNPNNKNGYSFSIVGYPDNLDENGGGTQEFIVGRNLGGFLKGFTGKVTVTCVFRYANPAVVSLFVKIVPTATAIEQWQISVWQALFNAAQSQFYAMQQNVNAQISILQNQLQNVDTLTLRREENDEIMRCALKWLLGPAIDFAFMPPNAQALFQKVAKEQSASLATTFLDFGTDFIGNTTGLSTGNWAILRGYEDMINFINQAIEWENVVFFTYSYFWDIPQSWNFIRQIQHDDKTRQAFLRAGSARIVLTVRQGWEVAWANFVNTGQITLPSIGSPGYLTIAKQIAAYDSTNYPGIPPANPNGGGLIDDDTPQIGTICSANIHPATVQPLTAPVTLEVTDASGFVVGATLILDNWEAGLNPSDPGNSTGPGGELGIGAQETQTITAINLSTTPNTVTVGGLMYSHSAPFPVVQAGAKGVLIGEWFEYTPTSGTDIQVTINPTGAYA